MTPAPSLVGRDQPLAELRALVAAALGDRGEFFFACVQLCLTASRAA